MGLGPAILELDHIHKIYGSGPTEVRALDDVSLAIRAGEFVAVMGPSGSGKSTCMNILGCLDVPTSGEYRFRGVDVAELDGDELALLRRNYIGFIFQSFNLLPRVNAVDNVELPLVYRGEARHACRAAAMRALAVVGLGERAASTSSQLSGGQQQRVAIARALVTEPSLVLADEPTGNLDTATSADIMNFLSQLQRERNMTVVMVTHEEDIARYAHRVIVFVDGEVVDDGTPDEVLS